MSLNALLVNGRPLDDLVWQILALEGYLSPMVPERATLGMAYGAGVWGSSVEVKPRSVSAVLDVRPATVVDRTTMIDAIRRRLTLLAELSTVDIVGRVLVAHLSDVRVEFYTGAHANPICLVTITWTAGDGAWRDVEPVLRALSSTRVACPVGTGVSHTVVYLKGAATAVVDPVIIVRAATGEEVSRLTLAGSLTTNMAMEIVSAQSALTLYDAGVRQTGTGAGDNWLASGTFPLLSGEDGASVTVELSSASGTPTGLLLHHRVWS